MSWARDWGKLWYTADAGTVVSARNDGTSSNSKYIPVLWAIKDRLVSAGAGAWTVLASSGKAGGGSLVANTDDNWLSSADLVSATSDTGNRSWILLKSPTSRFAGTFYLLIDYWGTNELYCNYYFTKSQPDIGSPATNARPPATGNEWSHLGVYIVRDNNGAQVINSMMAVRAHDGSFVLAVSSPIGGENCIGALYLFNVLHATRSWDTTKAASLVATGWGSRIVYSDTLQFKSLHEDGTEVTLEPVWIRASAQVSMTSSMVDPFSGDWVTWNVPMICTTTSKKTFRGELEDIFWGSPMGGEGTLMFANEVVKAIRIGPFTVPFDQVGGMP